MIFPTASEQLPGKLEVPCTGNYFGVRKSSHYTKGSMFASILKSAVGNHYPVCFNVWNSL